MTCTIASLMLATADLAKVSELSVDLRSSCNRATLLLLASTLIAYELHQEPIDFRTSILDSLSTIINGLILEYSVGGKPQ